MTTIPGPDLPRGTVVERRPADGTSFMERAYLDELARQLRLPEGLRSELRAQAAAA